MIANAPSLAVLDVRKGTAPLLALGALGLGLVLFVAAAPWIIGTYRYGVFVPAMAASGLLTIAATMLAPAVPVRAGLAVVIVLGIAMRVLAMADEPFLSTDIYRYVWDGRVQAAGINPYVHVPAHDALRALRDADIYPNINRAGYAVTAYPPVAQLFFLAVTRVAESVTAMRLAMVSCEIVVVAVMIDLLRRLRLPVVAVVAWVWHPLAVWEIAGSGHVDALMVALLMLGVWLLARSRRVWGAVTVALAALVKPYAVLALSAFWRPWDWRAPLAAVATVALCYAPYAAGAGTGVVGFLTRGYLGEEGFADGSSYWLVVLVRAVLGEAWGEVPGLLPAYALAAAAVMGWLAFRTVTRRDPTPEQALADIAALLMAGLFFLSPNYPWYVLAVVPFTVLGGSAPAWAMTLAAILAYRPLQLPANDLAWKTLVALPFVLALAAVLVRRRGQAPQFRRPLPWTS